MFVTTRQIPSEILKPLTLTSNCIFLTNFIQKIKLNSWILSQLLNVIQPNFVKIKHCAVLSSGKKAHHWKCIDMIVRLWVVNLKLTGKLVRFLAYLVDPHHKYWVQIFFKGGFILFILLHFNKIFLLKFIYSEKATNFKKIFH